MRLQRALQGPLLTVISSCCVSCRLATHVIKSVRNFSQAELRSVLAVYRDVCPRRHSLVPTLALMEDELAPYVSPSPQ